MPVQAQTTFTRGELCSILATIRVNGYVVSLVGSCEFFDFILSEVVYFVVTVNLVFQLFIYGIASKNESIPKASKCPNIQQLQHSQIQGPVGNH